ncbi:MAG: hypothetical protein ACRD22_20860 [Terriglobia bacterium]
MLISIQGFGSIWEQRTGQDPSDPFRYSHHSAFYNTTGIRIGGRYKHRWKLGGKIRFQGGSAFDSARIANNLNCVFECDEPEPRFTWMQMCCKRRLRKPEIPDWFLFRITSEQIGWIDLKNGSAKSDDTFLLSYSAEPPEQELLILMRPDSWIRGASGSLVAEPAAHYLWRARLMFHEYPGGK